MTRVLWTFVAAVFFLPLSELVAQGAGEQIQDITGKYHFLSPQDTLGLLEEEGKIKGWVDVVQEGDESDDVLTYQLTLGLRQKDHVEFKTSKIHQKYFRFEGSVRRGTGRKEGDPDYLRLVGDLEIITVNGETRKESLERKSVVLKTKGKTESEEE